MWTRRALNRSLLARQGLLAPFADPLPRVLDRIGGIQAQYAPSMYVGLWSRTRGFRRDDLTRALEDRSVVQGTLLRATIHLVSREDWWPMSLAVRDQRRGWVQRVTKDGPPAAEVAAAAEVLARALAERGPLRRRELDALVGRCRGSVGLWLDLVRVPPSGTWERRRADLYESAATWIGAAPALGVEEAQAHVVRRYLQGFGPARPAEITSWALLPLPVIERALAALDVVREVAEDGSELVDLPDSPRPDPETPVPPLFLPTWDATLLVHARRTGILPEVHRPRVFATKIPQSVNTFLVDGEVAGSWKWDGDHVALEPFAPLPAATLRAVEEAAAPLAALQA